MRECISWGCLGCGLSDKWFYGVLLCVIHTCHQQYGNCLETQPCGGSFTWQAVSVKPQLLAPCLFHRFLPCNLQSSGEKPGIMREVAFTNSVRRAARLRGYLGSHYLWCTKLPFCSHCFNVREYLINCWLWSINLPLQFKKNQIEIWIKHSLLYCIMLLGIFYSDL